MQVESRNIHLKKKMNLNSGSFWIQVPHRLNVREKKKTVDLISEFSPIYWEQLNV